MKNTRTMSFRVATLGFILFGLVSGCSLERGALAPGDTRPPPIDSGALDAPPRDVATPDSTMAFDSSTDTGTGADADVGVPDSSAVDSDVPVDTGAPDADACVVADERCDGMDEDCDGRVDEGLAECGGCDRRTNAGHSYLFCHDVRRDWFGARDHCRSVGYDLVVVGDAVENEWLRTTAIGIDGGTRRWWIGASDHITEMSYVWSATGAAVTYFNWNGASNPQPNDDIRAGDEDFVFLETNAGGTWFDHFVSTERFICESL